MSHPSYPSPANGGWRPALSGRMATRALSVAREVGTRLRNPERLGEAIAVAGADGPWRDSNAWQPVSLAQGHPGVALLFAQLNAVFPGQGWDEAAHVQMGLAVEDLRLRRSPGVGLFDGLPGLALAATLIDANQYDRLLTALDGLVSRHMAQLMGAMRGRVVGVAEDDYDLVSGLSGFAAFALARGDRPSAALMCGRLIDMILAEGEQPGWRTPNELLDPLAAERYPNGRLNCGLAHGIPGPLAILALVLRAGNEVDGHRAAIRSADSPDR